MQMNLKSFWTLQCWKVALHTQQAGYSEPLLRPGGVMGLTVPWLLLQVLSAVWPAQLAHTSQLPAMRASLPVWLAQRVLSPAVPRSSAVSLFLVISVTHIHSLYKKLLDGLQHSNSVGKHT